MKKKLVACLLTAAMTLSLAACGGGSGGGGSATSDGSSVSGDYEEVEIDGIKYHKAKDMTTENIQLKLLYYGINEGEANYLEHRFEEIYPNIDVVLEGNPPDYFGTLSSMFQSGDSPDVIQYTDADTALAGTYLKDITELWESDKETEDLPDTIKDKQSGFGTFSTGRRYACPCLFRPGIMYCDRTVFKKLNIDLPGQDWTWDEMINLVKKCKVEKDGVQYFGLGVVAGDSETGVEGKRLDSYYGIAAGQQYQGEFGYDGKEFHLDIWAQGEQQYADLKQDQDDGTLATTYVAPTRGSIRAALAYGDNNVWWGETGTVAIAMEGFWTFQNLWNSESFKKQHPDIDFIPYVIPAVSEEDATADHHSLADMEGAGVCSGTKHPREAYELMKFFYWGRDGWLTKIQLYKTGAIGYANGQLEMPGRKDDDGNAIAPIKNNGMMCPLTTNQEVWDEYIKLYCEGMSDEDTNLWKNYFQSCMHPISYGWYSIAGYHDACDLYFNSQSKNGAVGIHKIVDTHRGKASDYQDEGTRMFNYYHAKAMLLYFGKDSDYACLTDDQIAEYEKMMNDNAPAGGDSGSTEASQ